MKNRIHPIAPLCLALMIFGCLGRVPFARQAGKLRTVDQVLEGMGAVGKSFRSFEAKFTQRQYIAVLKEFDSPESGIFQYARAKDGSALLRQETRTPGVRILTIKGGVATVYQPKINQASIVSLGKNKDKAEYLALGLGQSPGKLRETFDIDLLGEETIDGSGCSVLSLKPKSSATAAFFSSFTLWIKNGSNVPIQQKLQEPSGNYLLVKFAAEKLNAPVSASQFDQKLPKGTEIQEIK
jgi:outer membrane lipoprotein-sorting protein